MKLTGHPKYSAASLAALEKQGRPLNFLYFWGHTNHGRIGKECLSQWSPHSLVIDGRTYRTAEHWMMAQKASLFADRLAYERILKAEQPRDAKALGRTVSNFEPALWDEHCYSLVRLGNIHKFNQHRSLYEFLLATGDSVIVEASPDDPVWGIALNEADARNVHFTQWQGRNLLGFALMEVRDILRDCGPFHSSSNSMQPPWHRYPTVDASDTFWRMGAGEQYLVDFSTYFASLPPTEQLVYALSYPAPFDWGQFF